ncbi:MAG: general secretion pathway protein GspB [Gammaproteobacteria bacterium]|nr:general secretion pathway protein GspB [Gammaproteobacteria bacterium]
MRERLPSYDISVISWSADPGRRFAMINGAIYREGDHLPEGPRIVAIESGRVVLTMLSETFFIVPRT